MNALLAEVAIDGFAWPWMLLLALAPWLVFALTRAGKQAVAALRVPWESRLLQVAQAPHTMRRLGGFAWLGWLAWCLLCVAAARPQQLGPPMAMPQQGRNLMLALDLSASMGEEDMQLGGRVLDRLTAAKAVLADFLARRVGDRVGLLVFADQAFALTPLTLDRESVREQLHNTVLGMIGRGTALGDAIGLASKRLASVHSGQKVLIVLTDGVNTAGLLEPEKAAQIARDEGVRIYTIAFGGDGRALSVFGFQLPLGGGDDVDEAGLQAIARMTGGRFFRARATEDLASIYAEIDKLEPVKQAGHVVRTRHELYPWPLAAALMLGCLLGWRRRNAA